MIYVINCFGFKPNQHKNMRLYWFKIFCIISLCALVNSL